MTTLDSAVRVTDQPKIWTVEEVDQSLVLVTRIMKSIRRYALYRNFFHLQSLNPDSLAQKELAEYDVKRYNKRITDCLEELNALSLEVEGKETDITVLFPSNFGGKGSYICYNAKQDRITAVMVNGSHYPSRDFPELQSIHFD